MSKISLGLLAASISVILAMLATHIVSRLSPQRPAPVRSLREYIMRVYGFYPDDVSAADRSSTYKYERNCFVTFFVTFVASLYGLAMLAHLLNLGE
jgi:hypothetical protein